MKVAKDRGSFLTALEFGISAKKEEIFGTAGSLEDDGLEGVSIEDIDLDDVVLPDEENWSLENDTTLLANQDDRQVDFNPNSSENENFYPESEEHTFTNLYDNSDVVEEITESNEEDLSVEETSALDNDEDDEYPLDEDGEDEEYPLDDDEEDEDYPLDEGEEEEDYPLEDNEDDEEDEYPLDEDDEEEDYPLDDDEEEDYPLDEDGEEEEEEYALNDNENDEEEEYPDGEDDDEYPLDDDGEDEEDTTLEVEGMEYSLNAGNNNEDAYSTEADDNLHIGFEATTESVDIDYLSVIPTIGSNTVDNHVVEAPVVEGGGNSSEVEFYKGMAVDDFLRKNPKIRDEADVLKYYHIEDLRSAVKYGKINYKSKKRRYFL